MINIPNKFILSKNNCQPFITSYGSIKKYPELYNKIGSRFYNLLCLINGNISYVSLVKDNYQANSENSLLLIAKVIILAELSNIYYFESKNKNIIFLFSYENSNIDNILVYLYLKFIKDIDRKYLAYISGKVDKYSISNIKGFFKIRYVNKYLPKDIKKAYNAEKKKEKQIQIQKQKKDINEGKNKKSKGSNRRSGGILDEVKGKIRFVKKYDNFKHFNMWFEKIENKSEKLIEKTFNSDEDFKKYKADMIKKAKPFKFNWKIFRKNNFYNKKMDAELNRFIKDTVAMQ